MDRSLIARAQEILATSPHKMTTEDAIADAIYERFDGDGKLIARYMATQIKGWAKQLRKNSYEVPEHPTLFDVPATIIVTSPTGDIAWPLGEAPAAIVGQWWTEGEQHHGSQHRRFKKGKQRHFAAGLDPERNYMEQAKALEQ